MRPLYVAFVLSMTFPYTQLLPMESYTQPYALVLGSVILAVNFNKVLRYMPTRDLYALFALAFVGVSAFLITCFPYTDSQELKYLLNYLTPLVLTAAAYSAISAAPQLVASVVAGSALLWFGVAMIQTLVDPTFMASLVGAWSEVAEDVVTSGRGVLGLAPEPTHHGFHMLVIGAVLVVFGKWRWIAALCVVEALLLARSSSSALALALGMAAVGLTRPSRLVVPAVLLVAAIVLAPAVLRLVSPESELLPENSRIMVLATAFLEDPSNLLAVDYSVSARIGGMIATFIHLGNTLFLPNGLSHDRWMEISQTMLADHAWLLGISENGPPSGVGIILFQLGFLGVPCLLLMWMRIVTVKTAAVGSILIFATFFVFLGQYNMSSPDFSLLYATAIWQAGRVRRLRAEPSMVPALLPGKA